MAHIRRVLTKNNKVHYKVEWKVGEKFKSKTFDRSRDANDYKIKLENDLKQCTYVAPTNKTIRSVTQLWFESKKDDYTRSTIDFYNYMTNLINEEIGDAPIQLISSADIEAAYTKIKKKNKLSDTTIVSVHKTVKVIFKYAIKKKIISINPMDIVVPPKNDEFNATIAEPSTIKNYLAIFEGTWMYPLVSLCMFCGLRRSEALALYWDDIDFKNRKISITKQVICIKDDETNKKEFLNEPTKTKRSRTITMPKNIVGILKHHQSWQEEQKELLGDIYVESGVVFTEDDGRRPDPAYVSRKWRRSLHNAEKRSGIQYMRFHDLRHTALSLMLYEGNDIVTVAGVGGHADPHTTARIYAHVIEKAKTEAADSINKYVPRKKTSKKPPTSK
jgi:integrase